MKKQAPLSRSLAWVAAVTLLLLAIPFTAMQFTPEVQWNAGDFLIMGALIFGTGMSYVLLTRTSSNIIYRIAMALTLGSTFLMIWTNLAVGLIGSGPNAGNLLYMAVLFVLVIATIRSGFSPAGMERAMYITALALVLHTGIAFLAGMQRYPGSSATEILAVNGFFAGLYLVAASLFRYAAKEIIARQS